MAEDGGDERRQVLALVVGRYDDESVHRCIARPTRLAAAATINVGSITGVRNRSWGKNTIDTQTAEAASSRSATGRRGLRQIVRAPAAAIGSRSRYGTTDAAMNRVECSVYEGPIGTTR